MNCRLASSRIDFGMKLMGRDRRLILGVNWEMKGWNIFIPYRENI